MVTQISEIVEKQGEFVLAFDAELESSIMDAPPYARLLFHYLRLLANRGKPRGKIRLPLHRTIEAALAFQFNLSEKDVLEGLGILAAPDPTRPEQEYEGRRIEVVNTQHERSVRILNWTKYQPRRGKGAPIGNKYAAKPKPAAKAKPKPKPAPELPEDDMDVLMECIQLIERAEVRKPTVPEIKAYITLEKDYYPADILTGVRWAVQDPFWKSVVLAFAPLASRKSAGDARKFDKLWAAFEKQQEGVSYGRN